MAKCPYCSDTVNLSAKASPGRALHACRACGNPFVVSREAGAVAASPLENTPDVRDVAPPGSLGAAVLAALPESVERLPMLPEISRRVLEMVRDPETSMQELANVIREDQVTSLAVMRLANSAVYGGLHEVTELSAACARLGLRTIANTVQAVANKNLYITGDKALRAFMERLWRHAVATAYCSEAIAAVLAEPNTESLFLAGLLHDVGKVALLDMVSGGYSGPLGELRTSPELLREVLDGFHMLVGLHVVQHWELPAPYRALIYFHNVPGRCFNEELLNGVHIICLADLIANMEGFGLHEPQENLYLMSHESTRHLNLSDVKLATLRVDLADRLEAVIEAVSGPAGAA